MKNNTSSQRPQITVFELLGVSFICICAISAARKLAVYWGRAGWIAGGLVGIACGFLFIYALWLLSDVYHRFRPLRPTCQQGKCHSADYQINVVVKEGSWEAENRCNCGDTYLRRGNRFMLRRPDGSTQPYMLRNPFRNWEPDNQHEDPN